MACPVDSEIIKEVEETTGLRVKRMLSPFDHVTRTLSTCYPQFSKLGFATDGDIPPIVKEFEPLLLTNEVARRIFALDALPPFKDTVENIGAALDAGANGSTLRAITDLVAMDPIATLSLLRISNSEAYGFPNRVDGLGMACTLLGSRAIHSVVGSVEPRLYRNDEGGFDFEACWRRAQFCAEAAQGIALQVNGQGSITAYTAGLLHDAGRLALQNVLPSSYGVLTANVRGAARDEVEERAFRLPAPEAGYLLARNWGLPVGLCEAIRYQRSPEKAKQAKDLTRTLALAVRMADAWENESSLNVDSLDNLLESLDLSRSATIEIMQETVESQATEKAPA
jgi:HD-like signal output (HDOD) protein